MIEKKETEVSESNSKKGEWLSYTMIEERVSGNTNNTYWKSVFSVNNVNTHEEHQCVRFKTSANQRKLGVFGETREQKHKDHMCCL